MDTRKLSEYKKKYALSKHHAWAGSILLAILLAIRIFLENSKIDVDDQIILLAGVILVSYMLISLIFTYRYRTGLSVEEKSVQYSSNDEDDKEKIRSKLEKEHLKIEKKKSKVELKKVKKSKK